MVIKYSQAELKIKKVSMVIRYLKSANEKDAKEINELQDRIKELENDLKLNRG